MKIDFILPKIAIDIFKQFEKSGYEIYLVGGAVRDIILNRPLGDLDFTTNATPEQIQKLFKKTIYNNSFGTVTVVLEDGFKVEITPYRSEGDYRDGRHPGKVAWAPSLEMDLSRRDFTVNAMAYNGKILVDPHKGLSDIEKKVIKVVGDSPARFEEDGLRLMRAVRFATQLDFTIENNTLDSIKSKSSLILKISWERIRDELFKILECNTPGRGILMLKESGILQFILPEVDVCFGVEQKSPGRHHVDDVGTHLIKSLNSCTSTNTITRLAVLLHDIGKAQTFAKDGKSGLITFFNHEIVGAHLANAIALRLKLSKEQCKTLVLLVRFHMFTVSEKQTDKAIKRFIRNVGVENLDEAIAMRVADRVGSGSSVTSWRTELFKKRLIEVQQEPFSIKDLKISGTDIMQELSIKPGPRVGQILTKLFDDVENGKVPNEKDALLTALGNL